MKKNKVEIMNCYNFLNKLKNYNLPISLAYHLFILLEDLEKKYKFFIEEEKKLLDKYKVTFDESGNATIEDTSMAASFIAEMQAASAFEVDITDNSIELDLKAEYLQNVKVTIEEIKYLSGLIIFKE